MPAPGPGDRPGATAPSCQTGSMGQPDRRRARSATRSDQAGRGSGVGRAIVARDRRSTSSWASRPADRWRRRSAGSGRDPPVHAAWRGPPASHARGFPWRPESARGPPADRPTPTAISHRRVAVERQAGWPRATRNDDLDAVCRTVASVSGSRVRIARPVGGATISRATARIAAGRHGALATVVPVPGPAIDATGDPLAWPAILPNAVEHGGWTPLLRSRRAGLPAADPALRGLLVAGPAPGCAGMPDVAAPVSSAPGVERAGCLESWLAQVLRSPAPAGAGPRRALPGATATRRSPKDSMARCRSGPRRGGRLGAAVPWWCAAPSRPASPAGTRDLRSAAAVLVSCRATG